MMKFSSKILVSKTKVTFTKRNSRFGLLSYRLGVLLAVEQRRRPRGWGLLEVYGTNYTTIESTTQVK